MKRLAVALFLGSMCLGCFAGCGNTANQEVVAENYMDDEHSEKDYIEEAYIGESLSETVGDYHLFPTPNTNFVGDTMPYYENGKFHIFYLADMRDNKVGYHPWALYETSNFYEYEDKGEVIPYGDSVQAQDIALGTGSVIKGQDGLYHAFYTGHNDTYEPKEAIMHAVSKDMYNWEKVPEDTFFADDAYSKNDFRDPYVLYVEDKQEYWMLVTTRTQTGGVIAKYTSKDLSKWTDAGVFFENDMGTDSNLECPSLLNYKGKWYLAFSDQWPNRLVHYRVSDRIDGVFEKPEQDVFDGNGFYAGRLETDGENLYVVGWNGTKNSHRDDEIYAWGGNMVVHQLQQLGDGRLQPMLNLSIKEKMSNELKLIPMKKTETVDITDEKYTFCGKDYEIVEFKPLNGSYRLDCTVKNFKNSERFGFAFNVAKDEVGQLNLLFNIQENKIEFFNTKEIYSEDAQSEIAMDFSKMDELKISMLISDGVVSMYVNDECAMTARMYCAQGTTWGICSMNADVSFESLKLYK